MSLVIRVVARLFLAFGETVTGFDGAPMSAAEARVYADRGWGRWVLVAAALEALEQAQSQPAQEPPQDTPSPTPTPTPTPTP